jgi:hypothetical protein
VGLGSVGGRWVGGGGGGVHAASQCPHRCSPPARQPQHCLPSSSPCPPARLLHHSLTHAPLAACSCSGLRGMQSSGYGGPAADLDMGHGMLVSQPGWGMMGSPDCSGTADAGHRLQQPGQWSGSWQGGAGGQAYAQQAARGAGGGTPFMRAAVQMQGMQGMGEFPLGRGKGRGGGGRGTWSLGPSGCAHERCDQTNSRRQPRPPPHHRPRPSPAAATALTPPPPLPPPCACRPAQRPPAAAAPQLLQRRRPRRRPGPRGLQRPPGPGPRPGPGPVRHLLWTGQQAHAPGHQPLPGWRRGGDCARQGAGDCAARLAAEHEQQPRHPGGGRGRRQQAPGQGRRQRARGRLGRL